MANIEAVPMPSNQLSSFEIVRLKKFVLKTVAEMARKKKTENSKKGGKNKPAQSPKTEDRTADHNEGGLDFGGIPERDLKKNLGCG